MMMKKFLVLLVCMASVASAIPTLTINGAPAPEEIWDLTPSDTLIIDAHIDIGVIGGTLDFVLSNEQGALDWSNVITNPNYALIPGYEFAWDFAWVVNVGATSTNVSIGGGNFSTGNGDERWIIDQLVFHCEDPTTVTLQMIAGTGGIDYDSRGVDIPAGTVLAEVIIHQPEPMTIALLGLGGLFLRRRK
jgi:hypothetical protein